MSEPSPWRYLIEQADRCLARDDRAGAEVHLTAALDRAREERDAWCVAEALVRLGRLRVAQRRGLAAERLLEEAVAILRERGEPEALARAEAALRQARS